MKNNLLLRRYIFSKLNWKEALVKILELNELKSAPLLIFMKCSLTTSNKVEKYFIERENVFYIRIGITCTIGKIIEDIAFQLKIHELSNKGLFLNTKFNKTIKSIMAISPVTIVITNCHLFVTRDVFMLFKIVNTLEHYAKVIFIFNVDFLHVWEDKINKGDNYLVFFLKMIKNQYQINEKGL